MRPIVETLAGRFALTDLDRAIANDFKAYFEKSGVIDTMHLQLFANLAFLLAHRPTIEYLLDQLEADVKALWQQEENNGVSVLKIHEPVDYVTHLELSWPLPTEELVKNKSYHLLNRVLLGFEQKHGINLPNKKNETVPTFVGFIPHARAIQVLIDAKLWSDESSLPGVFFHGKMTHRIQLYLVMKAMDEQLIDLGMSDVKSLITVLAETEIPAFKQIAWTILLDYITTNKYIDLLNPLYPAPLISRGFTPTINNNTYKHPYLFTNDPYFFSSYLLTASKNRPHLTECLTKIFSHAALRIQSLEKNLGKVYDWVDSGLCRQSLFQVRQIKEHELGMNEVLKRQADSFSKGRHLLSVFHILTDRKNRGKIPRNTKISTNGHVEFRKDNRFPLKHKITK